MTVKTSRQARYSSRKRFSSSRSKPYGPLAALIRDLTLGRKNVQAFRPAVEGEVGAVVHVVNQGRDGKTQGAGARSGEFLTLDKGLRLAEQNALLPIGSDLPAIRRVRFPNVDQIKRGTTLKPLIYLLQAARLTSKGRSGVAAENKDGGKRRVRCADNNGNAPVARGKGDFRRGVPHFQLVRAQVADLLEKSDGFGRYVRRQFHTSSLSFGQDAPGTVTDAFQV